MIEELNKLAKAMRDMSDMVGDLHWMAAKAVEDLIKKDARIAELEALSVTKVMLDIVPGDGDGYEVYAKSVSDVETKLGELGEENEELQFEREQLRAELAAIKAQEPVAWPEGGSDAVEGAALGAFDSLGQPEHDLESWCAGYAEAVYAHAAPVSEAKAQGVVMPGRDAIREVFMRNGFTIKDGQDDLKPYVYAAAEELLQLATPVQQVIVPPFAQKVIRKLERFQECTDDGQGVDIGRHWFDLLTQLGLLNRVQRSPALWEITQQGEDLLAAAQAAPAADAGLVEALGYQVLFDAIAAATSVYANGAINISVQAFRAALAAHRAKGVV